VSSQRKAHDLASIKRQAKKLAARAAHPKVNRYPKTSPSARDNSDNRRLPGCLQNADDSRDNPDHTAVGETST
jgi:hypothetical protein